MASDAIDLARAAYDRMAWGDAYAQFVDADRDTPLAVDDLERAARAAQLIGRDSEVDRLWPRAIHESERTGDPDRAACNAFWLGMSLMNRGDLAQAGGWWARAQRLLADHELDTATNGYLMLPEALGTLFGGDPATAEPIFVEALSVGERFAELDLVTLARLGLGRSRLGLGRSGDGMALLDDAMTCVTTGEVSPFAAGIVYCAVIEACHSLFDFRRAREWTEALSRWCDEQPDLVPFRGQCLTHRAQIMTRCGAWTEAMDEVEQACTRLLEPPPQAAVADALYQKGELLRLRGDFAAAEAAYRETSQWGREPQPGLAQLRLAQGQAAAAEAAIRRVVDETQDVSERAALLVAFVDILLAVADVASAGEAAEELGRIAADVDAPCLLAMSAYATGAIALADGDAPAAIVSLRRAWIYWCDVDAPYDAARARVLIAVACRELGDDDTSTMELDAARRAFEDLGAAPDLQRLAALTTTLEPRTAGGLTGREAEVLRLIAAGHTNRQIADELFISERTVARHVSNIFTKLAVSSRSAATGYAFRHGLT